MRSVLESAIDDVDATIISRRDSEDAVVMSLDHYNSLIETVHLLKSPNNAARLNQSIQAYQAGQAVEKTRLMHELQFSWTRSAWKDYLYWQTQDRTTLKRINKLIAAALRSPFEGIGKPKSLKENLSCFWSRRINDVNRLVYAVDGNVLTIIMCRYHY